MKYTKGEVGQAPGEQICMKNRTKSCKSSSEWADLYEKSYKLLH